MDDLLARAVFEAGVAHCRVAVENNEGLLLALSAAGLLGSWSHCVGMCGSFVLTQVSARLEDLSATRMSERHRWVGALVIPYHLGRMTTYVSLGTIGATITAGAQSVPGFRWVAAGLLLLAALSFLLAASGRRPPSRPNLAIGGRWSASIRALLAYRSASPGWQSYRLGVALGFIPCGLLYGALAAAAATGNPLAGGLGMAAFGIGTVPGLVMVGLVGHLAGQTRTALLKKATPVLLVVNALGLMWLAWRMVAA